MTGLSEASGTVLRSRHAHASLLMLLASLFLIANDTGMKALSEVMPTGSTIILRNSIGALALFVFIAMNRELRQLPAIFGWAAVLRTLLDSLLTMLFLVALAHMPIANLTAIVQSLPVVVAAMAVFTLKEKLSALRLFTILAGFAGVLLIVQPGSESFNLYSLLGVVVVFLGAARDILTRYVPGHVPGSVIAFGNLVGAGLASLALAWNEGGLTLPPDAASWFIGTSSGLCVALGLIVLIKSLRLAPMSVTAPFRYSVVVYSIISGWIFFDDVPNALAWAGMGLIVLAGLATLRR